MENDGRDMNRIAVFWPGLGGWMRIHESLTVVLGRCHGE